MKIHRLNLQTLTLQVEEVEDVVRIMLLLRDEFMAAHGREPLGFIVGPREYLALKLVADQRMWNFEPFLGRDLQLNLETVAGLPIHVKMTPGIELAIDSRWAAMFADPRR